LQRTKRPNRSNSPRDTMKIDELDFYLVRIEHVAPVDCMRSLLVRLVTDSGEEGWGETRIDWQVEQLAGRRDALLAVLAGRSIFDIEELHTLEALRDTALRSAVEMAFWDLVGRCVGQPLCHLFGGGYRPRIPVAVRLADGRPDQVVHVARELAEQGFHCQIVTSCGSPEQDRDVLAAIREITGDRTELRLDAAARYDLDTARELCANVEPQGLQFLLDPLDTLELYEVASLGRQVNVPLAVWRSIHRPADVLAAVRCGAAPFVVIDLQQVGGMVPARKSAAVADAAAVGALLGGGPSLGIATAAMLQLAASTPALAGCHECAYHQLQDDVLVSPLEIVDGMMAVPQAPGLGVEVDRAKVERCQVGG